MESLESRKKNLALTLLYYLSQELWLGKSRKLVCTNQSRFYNFSPLPLKKKKKKIALFLDISQVKIFLSFTRQHSWMCIRITRINNFNFKTKKKDKKTKSKRKKTRKENICEKSNGIQWYPLRICSVFFWLTWSSVEFLLDVHVNLMFICNERNHSIYYTRTTSEVSTFTGPYREKSIKLQEIFIFSISHRIPPIAILCIFIGAIQQVRHLKRRVDKESNKNDIDGKACSQKSDVSHINSSLHFFLYLNIYSLLVSHKVLLIITASKKSIS